MNGLAGMMLMGAGSAFGRDPRRGCGTGNRDVDWIGERMAYGYQYGASQTAQKKSGFSFNLADFGKEIFVGAVTGGLASAAFYGAGKAVQALRGSIRSSCNFTSGKLMDGTSMKTNDVLNLASDFLGEGYTEPKAGSGRFISADGTRAFRMGESDILGRHGGGPHVNFEMLELNPIKPNKMQVITDIHIYLED